jgi:hypothetical protein
MKTHIVSPQAWAAAREQMLVKEKAMTRARDALAAERRRMPGLAVEKDYAFEFDGPERIRSARQTGSGKHSKKETRRDDGSQGCRPSGVAGRS